jgi:hypothetical protein
MKPRLAPLRLVPDGQPEPVTLREFYHGDAEIEKAVKAVIASFGEFVTLKMIARALNCTSEFVRLKLVETDKNSQLKMVAGKWQVTKARAARFITQQILER